MPPGAEEGKFGRELDESKREGGTRPAEPDSAVRKRRGGQKGSG